MSINFELQLIDIFCIKINLQKNTPAVTLKKSGYYRVSLDVAGSLAEIVVINAVI